MNKKNLLVAFLLFSQAIFADPLDRQPEKVAIDLPVDLHAPAGPYRLQVGDVLNISLYGSDEIKSGIISPVTPTGNLILPLIGDIYALGKTIDEVRNDLNDAVSKIYPGTLACVTSSQLLGNHYTILGEVLSPGTYLTTGNTTLLSAIGQAGGFPLRALREKTYDFVDLDKAFIMRNKQYLPVDFKALVYQGDLSQDLIIQGGDYIYIPMRKINSIYVLGMGSKNPIVYDFVGKTSLMEVLAYSGGLTIDASSRALVLRGALHCPEVFRIDLNLISLGCEPDFPLLPGDIVYFPVMEFAALKRMVRFAIANFVNSIASVAGNEAYVELNPRARGLSLPNNISTANFTPITAVPP